MVVVERQAAAILVQKTLPWCPSVAHESLVSGNRLSASADSSEPASDPVIVRGLRCTGRTLPDVSLESEEVDGEPRLKTARLSTADTDTILLNPDPGQFCPCRPTSCCVAMNGKTDSLHWVWAARLLKEAGLGTGLA